MTEERIIRIEMILAHQERQIQDLSEMIALQWQQIALLGRQLEMAQDRLGSLGATDKTDTLSVAEMAALEKPPHY